MLLNLKTEDPLKELETTLFNRCFRYGDGIFETIKISFGKVVHEEQHLSRMLDGLSVLGMEIPSELKIGFLQNSCDLLLKDGDSSAGTMRVYLCRDGEGSYLPDSDEVQIFGNFTAGKSDLFDLNAKGLKLGIYRDIALHYNKLSALKTCNALPYVLAARFARHRNFDEVLLLDAEGFVAEASSHNVITYRKGELYAPSIYQGGVEGVMLNRITEVSNALNIHLHRTYLTIGDIEEAESVFLTNATSGVKWVSNFKNSSYESSIGQSLIDKLNENLSPVI